jgi:hypothetical protein
MLENHRVVSHREWLEARRELLKKEKEFTRLRNQLWRVAPEFLEEAPDDASSLNGEISGNAGSAEMSAHNTATAPYPVKQR